MSEQPVVRRLLASPEPSVRLKAEGGILRRPADDALVRRLGGEVTRSERVRRLLSERRSDGTIPFHPYRAKWYGAH